MNMKNINKMEKVIEKKSDFIYKIYKSHPHTTHSKPFMFLDTKRTKYSKKKNC